MKTLQFSVTGTALAASVQTYSVRWPLSRSNQYITRMSVVGRGTVSPFGGTGCVARFFPELGGLVFQNSGIWGGDVGIFVVSTQEIAAQNAVTWQGRGLIIPGISYRLEIAFPAPSVAVTMFTIELDENDNGNLCNSR